MSPPPQASTNPGATPPADDDHNQKLETKKLDLETKLLEKQWKFWWLEIAKTVVGAIGLAGVVVTLILGLLNLQEARQSHDDERFDKAVSRLGSSNPSERLAGVGGLWLFLESKEETRHRATLRFLINALAVEQDATVRGELLDSFSRITPKVVSQNDLNDALEQLRDRNRTLYARQRAIFLEKWTRGIAKLTDTDETYVGDASEENLAPLRATAAGITAMVRNGARVQDLSNIYCVGCDFTGKTWEMMNPNFSKVADFAHADAADIVKLSATNFSGAILRDSNFIGADLHGASFDSADVLHVNFAGADLAEATFTDYGHRDYVAARIMTAGSAYAPVLPDFTCADLSGADFTGSVFLGIFGDRSNDTVSPILYQANLTNAKLGKMWILTASQVPPDYKPTPPEEVNSYLFRGFAQAGSISNAKSRTGEPVVIHEFWGLPSLQIKEPVPEEYWISARLVFSELASARNLDRSELPQGLKEFILRNQRFFSNPNHPTPCVPKH